MAIFASGTLPPRCYPYRADGSMPNFDLGNRRISSDLLWPGMINPLAKVDSL